MVADSGIVSAHVFYGWRQVIFGIRKGFWCYSGEKTLQLMMYNRL